MADETILRGIRRGVKGVSGILCCPNCINFNTRSRKEIGYVPSTNSFNLLFYGVRSNLAGSVWGRGGLCGYPRQHSDLVADRK